MIKKYRQKRLVKKSKFVRRKKEPTPSTNIPLLSYGKSEQKPVRLVSVFFVQNSPKSNQARKGGFGTFSSKLDRRIIPFLNGQTTLHFTYHFESICSFLWTVYSLEQLCYAPFNKLTGINRSKVFR